MVVVLVIFGVLALCLNWHLRNVTGCFEACLAVATPWFFIWAGYYAIFSDDPDVVPRPMPLRMVLTLGISFVLGFANMYALRHGLY